MADRYVAKNGNDGNPGSLAQPYLTVAAALNASAFDDRIFIRKGVYTDVWPFNKVLGRHIEAYQGEDVIIDCEGTRNYVTSAQVNQSGQTALTIGWILIGLKFVNYLVAAFDFLNIPNSMNNKPVTLLRLFWKAQTNSGTFAHNLFNNLSGITDVIRMENNTFIGHEAALLGSPGEMQTFLNNAFKSNTYSSEVFLGFNSEAISGYQSLVVEKNYNAYPGNTGVNHDPNGINSSTSPFSFRDESNGDYSLPVSSALRGAGKNGGNIGAPFYPHARFDNDFAPYELSAGENDEDWYDTNLMAPGPDGPADAGPAVFSGGSWKIDNVTVPGAKSARVKLGPATLPAGAVVSTTGWDALEDTSLAGGQKQVVDFTGGTGTRDMQLSINGGAKQTVTKTTNVNQAASSVTGYMTLRADGV